MWNLSVFTIRKTHVVPHMFASSLYYRHLVHCRNSDCIRCVWDRQRYQCTRQYFGWICCLGFVIQQMKTEREQGIEQENEPEALTNEWIAPLYRANLQRGPNWASLFITREISLEGSVCSYPTLLWMGDFRHFGHVPRVRRSQISNVGLSLSTTTLRIHRLSD